MVLTKEQILARLEKCKANSYCFISLRESKDLVLVKHSEGIEVPIDRKYLYQHRINSVRS